MQYYVDPTFLAAVEAELAEARAGALLLRTPRLSRAVAAAFSREPLVRAEGREELNRLVSDAEAEPSFDLVWWKAAALLEQRDFASAQIILESIMRADPANERAAALHALWRAAVQAEANKGLSRLAWGVLCIVGVVVVVLAVRRGPRGGGAPARAAAASAVGTPALARAPAVVSAVSSAASSAAAAAAPVVDTLQAAAGRAWDAVQGWRR